jgi:hypothetical protein
VESGDVVSAAARYVRPSQVTSLIVGDHAAIAASLDALGLGAPLVLSPDD